MMADKFSLDEVLAEVHVAKNDSEEDEGERVLPLTGSPSLTGQILYQSLRL